jgi:hypothetical protein
MNRLVKQEEAAPAAPPPRSLTCVVVRTNSLETARSSCSSSPRSTSSGRSATRSKVDTMASMSMRALLAATLLAAMAGCGSDERREVRLLAPAGIVSDAESVRFEQETDCRVDLRVYDSNEDLEPIAKRRDSDNRSSDRERRDSTRHR